MKSTGALGRSGLQESAVLDRRVSIGIREKPTLDSRIRNAITVDVEDYFQVSAFEPYISRANWDQFPLRVEKNTERILELFEMFGIRGTFFMLGWIAERIPGLARRIVESGHELASHGYAHVRVYQQMPEEFRQDVLRTKRILEDLGGCEVRGYRAASFSIRKDTLWAVDILQESGYLYSSSIYPVHHDLYGIPEAPRFPFRHNGTGLHEIPISTVRALNQNLPVGGGGYFRIYPYGFFRRALHRVNRDEGQPVVFYFHPWEIDPDQPRPTIIT
jgi:polysaccharide deacetylase family protein (PEP-CTERM system associated)